MLTENPVCTSCGALKTVHQNVDNKRQFTARVEGYLEAHLGAIPNLNKMAYEFHCSQSTFRRRLKKEGHTFREVVSGFRSRQAKKFLSQTDIPPKAISHLLGYQEPRTFYRAFKEWTGMSIKDYRKG